MPAAEKTMQIEEIVAYTSPRRTIEHGLRLVGDFVQFFYRNDSCGDDGFSPLRASGSIPLNRYIEGITQLLRTGKCRISAVIREQAGVLDDYVEFFLDPNGHGVKANFSNRESDTSSVMACVIYEGIRPQDLLPHSMRGIY